MDAAQVVELAALANQKAVDHAISRGGSPIQQFYNGATVFVTGGSGFIGKQLIEKLLRSCKIKSIYTLLRPKKGKLIQERLSEILKDPIFKVLHKNQSDFKDRLIPIEGDMAEIGLGIDEKIKERILEEIEVIFHVAATLSFETPLRSATLTNVRGTRETIKLAKHCKRLKSFVHVSTAYSHATLSRAGSRILEKFYPSPFNPELMIQIAEEMEEEKLNQIQQSLTHGWPNSYTFSKALSEELLRTTAGDLPVAIIRPTIVICSKNGHPGWLDKNSILGASGLAQGLSSGVIHAQYLRSEINIDFVPVDYVCNAAIVAGPAAKEHPLKIYHLGSSCRNSTTCGFVVKTLTSIVGRIYASNHSIWYCFSIETSKKWLYLVFKCLLHELPAYIMDKSSIVLKKPQRLRKIYTTIHKLNIVFSHFLLNDWIFDDKNTQNLYQNLSETDKLIFHHDIADVDWKNMTILWGIGLRKYILRDGLKNTDLGVKRQAYFKIISYIIFGLVLFFIWMLFSYVLKLVT